MIMVTTVLAPILLRRAYEKEPQEEEQTNMKPEREAPDFIPTYPVEFTD